MEDQPCILQLPEALLGVSACYWIMVLTLALKISTVRLLKRLQRTSTMFIVKGEFGCTDGISSQHQQLKGNANFLPIRMIISSK